MGQALLIDCAPKIVLLAIDLEVVHTGKYFIDVEGGTLSLVSSFQAAGVRGAELDAPEADWFSTHHDPSLIQQIFNIAVAQVKSIIKPDSVRNDFWRKSVAHTCVHEPSLPISAG